jgi:hypothetical protein
MGESEMTYLEQFGMQRLDQTKSSQTPTIPGLPRSSPATWRSISGAQTIDESPMKTRRTSISLIVLIAISLSANIAIGAEPARKPNVVLILADDMNYECCCGEEIARENHCFSPSSEMN